MNESSTIVDSNNQHSPQESNDKTSASRINSLTDQKQTEDSNVTEERGECSGGGATEDILHPSGESRSTTATITTHKLSLVARGLLSPQSIKRLSSNGNEQRDDSDSDGSSSCSSSYEDEELQQHQPMTADMKHASLGLMGKNSMRSLVKKMMQDPKTKSGKSNNDMNSLVTKMVQHQKINGTSNNDDSDSSSEMDDGKELRSNFQKKCLRGQLPMSSRSLLKQGADAMGLARQLEVEEEDDSSSDEYSENILRGSVKTRCLNGQLPMSSKSFLKQGADAMNLVKQLDMEDDESTGDVAALLRHPSGELRSASKGIVSSSSMADFHQVVDPPKISKRRISFAEDSVPNVKQQGLKTGDSNDNIKPFDELIISKGELASDLNGYQEEHKDMLSEGQIYLGISMLVYMYSHLRETARQGLTRVRMEDIDVHSCYRQYNSRRKIKYLSKTKTVGSIIRVLVDELDDEDENDADHELLSGEGREYEKR